MDAGHSTDAPRRRGERRARLALVVLGVVLALLLLEAALQIGAFCVELAGHHGNAGWTTRNVRVLCLGDSNTYGIWLDGSEAYPAVLQKLWNDSHPARPIEVLNLGVPGNNSSRLRNALPKLLRRYRPDLVTIMLGANDWWTVPEPLSDGGSGGRLASFLWRWSRVYRLAFMIRRAEETSEGSVEATGYPPPRGPGPRPPDVNFGWTRKPEGFSGWEPVLAENLEAMVAELGRAGVRVTLLTYPADAPIYHEASDVLRAVAQKTATPLVDVGAVFQPLCAPQPCDDMLFPNRHPAGQHPTAKGHELVARTLLGQLALPVR